MYLPDAGLSKQQHNDECHACCTGTMEHRSKPFTISRPQPIEPVPNVGHRPLGPPAPTAAPNGSLSLRPLSDIRELSEPSIADQGHQRALDDPYPRLNTAKSNSLRRKPVHRTGSTRSQNSAKQPSKQGQKSSQVLQRTNSTDNGSSSYSSTPERSSFYSIPHSSVPRRTSSHGHYQARPQVRKPSIREAPPPAHPTFEGYFVPNHGHSRSPVKEASTKLDAVKSDGARRVPSRTYIRKPHPADILESPTFKHPRVKLELHVSAPLFVGGGSVEGQVKVIVDENERQRSRRSLGIGALAIDLVGFEDMSGGRKASFLAVGTELIDAAHPPPVDMVEPISPLAPNDSFWALTASTSHLAFMVSLPLEPGPPPFQSKKASIRYLLCATALINDAGKHYRVRVSQEVHILPTYDPDKALTSLASPLTASDELRLAHFGRSEHVKLTAGVHRQVWVSGSSVFVDVHIANKSHKPVKRLELSLERNILCYKHAPASTREKSISAARIFENKEQAIINRLVLKPGAQSWSGGVGPYSSETRTYELELPRGHATVHCGKYFEVRFFLNVSVSLSNTKLVSVQLPMILIHINSLDVLPNSVDQVAAAIEEKKRAKYRPPRTRSKKHSHSRSRNRSASSPSETAQLSRKPSYGQGRAFSAPVEQAIDRQRAIRADIQQLGQKLDGSPRKHPPQLHGVAIKKMGSITSIGGVSVEGKTSGNPFRDAAPKTPVLEHEFHRTEETRREPASGVPRMQSLRSTGSKRSILTTRWNRSHEDENKPKHSFTVRRPFVLPPTIFC